MTMKVHELITKLQQYPADTAIKIGIDRICYPEVGLVDVEYLTEDPNIDDEDREIEAEAVACGSMALEEGTEYPRVLLWISDPQ